MEGASRRRAGRGDAHRHRHRRRLRLADASAGPASGSSAGLFGALQAAASPDLAREHDGRWRVEVRGYRERRDAIGARKVRLHRRRRRRAAAAAEVGHPGRPRLWRLSRSAASGCAATIPTVSEAPPRQGLRQGRGRLAADVGAASRYARHRRPALAAVRSLCRLLEQVPQARLAAGPASESIRPGNIKPMLAVARDNFDLTEYLIGQVLQSEGHRLAALDEYYPKADPKDWQTAGRGPAGPDHQAGRQARRDARVRHRAGRRGGSFAGRAARRFARGLDRRVHRHQRAARSASPTS